MPSGWSQLLSWFVDHLVEDSWHQRLEGGRGQDSSCPRGSSLLQVRDAAAVGPGVLISFPSQLKRVFLFSSSVLFKRRNHSGNKWHSVQRFLWRLHLCLLTQNTIQWALSQRTHCCAGLCTWVLLCGWAASALTGLLKICPFFPLLDSNLLKSWHCVACLSLAWCGFFGLACLFLLVSFGC